MLESKILLICQDFKFDQKWKKRRKEKRNILLHEIAHFPLWPPAWVP